MDLLGSILSNMDKPPEADEKQKEQKKSMTAYLQQPNRDDYTKTTRRETLKLWFSFYFLFRAKGATGKTASVREKRIKQFPKILWRAHKSIRQRWEKEIDPISTVESNLPKHCVSWVSLTFSNALNNNSILHITNQYFLFAPQNRHDVTQIAGLTAMSFGAEEVDRYIVVYKKDFGPSEDEIAARRNDEIWNEEKAKEYAQKVVDTLNVRERPRTEVIILINCDCISETRS